MKIVKRKIGEVKNKIICGDTLKELKKLPDECVDMIITSPPYYGLRDYQTKGQLGLEKTFQEYLDKMLKITAELKRVLKKSGQFWLNMGDCYGGAPAGNKSISEANIGTDSVYVRKMKQCQGAKSFVPNFSEAGKLSKAHSGRGRGQNPSQKCLLMQPERLTLAMIDQQGWILRNKVKWAKQVLLKKENRTIGSVMPTSVKDRFNEAGEELYFFVKNKKYWCDLDAVRLKHSVPLHSAGSYEYERENLGSFNYRVRDAKRKSKQCPQFKATEKEIKKYNEIPKDYGKKKKGVQGKKLNRWMSGTPNYTYQGKFAGRKDAEMFNSPRARTQRYAPADHRGPNDKTEKNYGLKRNKVNDPRGTHEGGPGSWRDNLDDREYRKRWAELKEKSYGDDNKKDRRSRVRAFMDTKDRKRWKGQKEAGVPATYIGPTGEDHNLLNYPGGKNIPTIWLVQSEPHNFQKELGLSVEHFAIFPQALLEIPILFGCPKWICKKCGKAKVRVTKNTYTARNELPEDHPEYRPNITKSRYNRLDNSGKPIMDIHWKQKQTETLGWTDCKCGAGFEAGIVLDPFLGSGTSAVVVKRLGRNYIGIELNKEYIKIAKQRIKAQATPLL